MKKTVLINLLVLIFGIMIISCSKKSEEKELSKGTIDFSMSIGNESLKSVSDLKSEQIPHSIFISIKDADQNTIFELEELPLIKMEGQYITKKIELPIGNYTIEEFLVVDNNDSVIYLTPKEGTKLESLVENALPVTFQITSNNTTSTILEVIPANLGTPKDFGYATFSFKVVNTLEFGLVAYYPFNGNAKDETIDSNNGKVSGATLVPDRFGDSNKAYYFDGAYDYILVQDHNELDFEDFSISVWINTTQHTTDNNGRCIVDKYPQDSKPWSLRLSVEGTARFICDDNLYSSKIINDGNWHHIVVTKKDTITKLYVDNIFEDEGSSYTSSSNNFIMTIGKQNASFLRDFEGIIDDVRVYNRALIKNEISMLYNLD